MSTQSPRFAPSTTNSRLKRSPKIRPRRHANVRLSIQASPVLVKSKAVGGVNRELGNDVAALHYTSGNNIDSQGNFAPASAGFNLADVSSVDELNALPDGVMGLIWLDQHSGVTDSFVEAVTPFIGNPRVFGFFLTDEPDPTGQWNTLVHAEDLMAESDWIHENLPGAQTFITMMNMGSTEDPSFADTYNWDNTHIDLFGLDPYPVRTNGTLDFEVIDRHVDAALDAGISLDQIVPVYQTFGGGNWATDTGGRYEMPDASQLEEMFARWDALVPNAAFDYAYSWGEQNGDVSLESSQALQEAFLQHNGSEPARPVPEAPAPEAPPVQEPDVVPPDSNAGGEDSGNSPPTQGPSAENPNPNPWDHHGNGAWHDHGRGSFDFSQFFDRGRFDWAEVSSRFQESKFAANSHYVSQETAGGEVDPSLADVNSADGQQFEWAGYGGWKMGDHQDHGHSWHW